MSEHSSGTQHRHREHAGDTAEAAEMVSESIAQWRAGGDPFAAPPDEGFPGACVCTLLCSPNLTRREALAQSCIESGDAACGVACVAVVILWAGCIVLSIAKQSLSAQIRRVVLISGVSVGTIFLLSLGVLLYSNECLRRLETPPSFDMNEASTGTTDARTSERLRRAGNNVRLALLLARPSREQSQLSQAVEELGRLGGAHLEGASEREERVQV